MYKLVHHLSLARRKIIRSRKDGVSFDPEKKASIPSLINAEDWTGEMFMEFRKKIEQARVVIFTVLPAMDEPDDPDTIILTSLWGEVLVSNVKELAKVPDGERREMEGFSQLRDFFGQPHTAYVVERVDRMLKWMERLGLGLDDLTVTGLETWHLLGQGFCPAVELVFPELWGRLTASFRGSATSGWAWNLHRKEESHELVPDQTRLAFAIGNALATLTLDGIVARVDPEDHRPLADLGSLVLHTEQEGILEGEETLGLRALRLGAEDSSGAEGLEAKQGVSWSDVQVAYREPLGRVRWAERIPVRDEEIRPVLKRKKEVIIDIFTWEESISRVMLLGPEHQGPDMEENEELPEPPGPGILLNLCRKSGGRFFDKADQTIKQPSL